MRPAVHALPFAVAVLAATLTACAELGARGAAAGGREIRIGPASGSGQLVVCAEPQPAPEPTAAETAVARALRRGLFEICEGYRAGTVSASEYGAALEGYPALVLQTAALQTLEQREFHSSSGPQIASIRRQLAANPALPVLCRTASAGALAEAGEEPALEPLCPAGPAQASR